MHKVWDGTEWSSAKALKVWNGTQWKAGLKFKVRTSSSWLPGSVSDKDDSQIVKWSVDAPTPPPPPPPVTHPVPDLDLKTLQEVEALLDPLSFTYAVTEYETTSDATRDDKVVIDSQIPASGQSLAEGSQVVFKLYNFVQPTTTVPNLDNLLVTAANTAITNANLRVSTNIGTDETYDNNLIGRVIVGSQYPAANVVVDTDTEVTYDMWVQKAYTTVPDLVGDNETTVFDQLNAANLNPGTRTVQATSNASLNEKVKSQFPAANTQAEVDSNVNYEVWDYSLRVVPDLNNKPLVADANATLSAIQLYGDGDSLPPVETTVIADEGRVVPNSQNYAAGTEVPEGQTIKYRVYIGNTTVTVPDFDLYTMAQINSWLASVNNEVSITLAAVQQSDYTNDTNLQYKVVPNTQSHIGVVPVGTSISLRLYAPFPTYTVPDIRNGFPSTGSIDSNFTWGSNSLAGTGTENTGLHGKVATQSPTQGTQQQAGSINYGLYTDSRPIVPNVVGQTETNAKSNINLAGLNWTVTRKAQTSNGQATAGTVASQSPTGGQRLASGGYVTIEVWDAYQAQPVTRTGIVLVGWQGDVAMQWQASYRDTLGVVSTQTDGGRRTTTEPFFFGQFDSTNGKQHHAFHYDWNTFDTKAKQVSGGADYTITNVELRYWLNNSIGNTNAKSLRVGSYPSMVSSSPTTMREVDINTRGLTLSAATRGMYAYATLTSTLRSDIFTYPNYPCVVYAPNTSLDNYGSNDSDVRFIVTIQWTELV
jgi:beta-lactam-binding protein with PASTA domain